VIGYQQGFPQNRLSVAVGYRREQVGVEIGDQVVHRLKISSECLNAVVPGLGCRWRVAGGPVDCEDEDAPLLKNAKVLFDHAVSGTPNQALVDQLNRTADVLANYGFSEAARLWEIEANNVHERLQKDDLG